MPVGIARERDCHGLGLMLILSNAVKEVASVFAAERHRHVVLVGR